MSKYDEKLTQNTEPPEDLPVIPMDKIMDEPPEPGLTEEEKRPKITTWADIDAVLGPVTYAWDQWLPNGLLTMLAAISGIGKSALSLWLAGVFILGWDWPDGTPFTGETGAVLWCEAESAEALNKERATAWGIPLEKIYTPFPNDPLYQIMLDEELHRSVIYERAMLPEVKFIVIDSFRGAHSKRERDDDQMMNITGWLAKLAQESNKPLLIDHHLRKKGPYSNEVELDDVRGSSAIVQPMRVIWALDNPNPSNKDSKRLKVIKSNLGRFAEPLGMEWKDDLLIFTDAPEKPQAVKQLDQACDLLLELLATEPELVETLKKDFKNMDISWRTANTAKKKLGIVSKKTKDGWTWGLPHKE